MTSTQSLFVGAIAGLASHFTDSAPYSSCNLDLGWKHPNATLLPDSRSVNNTKGC